MFGSCGLLASRTLISAPSRVVWMYPRKVTAHFIRKPVIFKSRPFPACKQAVPVITDRHSRL